MLGPLSPHQDKDGLHQGSGEADPIGFCRDCCLESPAGRAVRPSGEPLSVAYDATGITTVIAQLSQRPPTVRVGEAPGAVERLLLRELVAAALPVIVVHPRQVRACAKATGQLAQTDALDAQVVARFAEGIRPPLRVIPDAQPQALAAPLARRDADLDDLIPQSPVWRAREDRLQRVPGIGPVMSRTVLAELPEETC